MNVELSREVLPSNSGHAHARDRSHWVPGAPIDVRISGSNGSGPPFHADTESALGCVLYCGVASRGRLRSRDLIPRTGIRFDWLCSSVEPGLLGTIGDVADTRRDFFPSVLAVLR
ncbi:hypothetical protein GWI33_005324 [Rhynchophorus ferrugineus]|uniref:Uncharacterized protein n=1 Tax=Rhynchophorus ferrugineus TaxID=354439 RepID=A0A834ISB5_RHYFE|nr:hypothetical protein GWI33_005324 [Rhynchophorus ferrugineus]